MRSDPSLGEELREIINMEPFQIKNKNAEILKSQVLSNEVPEILEPEILDNEVRILPV